jgi:hypothetical protein
VALRILPSSHNLMFVLVDGQPVRARRRAPRQRCLRAKSTSAGRSAENRGEASGVAAEAAYEHARQVLTDRRRIKAL